MNPDPRRARVAVLLMAVTAAAQGCRRAETPGLAARAAGGLGRPGEVTPGAGPVARGRQIYLTGESPSAGTITAVVGDSVEVPARLVACANCHGRDGRGGVEGVIAPSDLSWSTLTRPYDLARPDGRRRPPYTEPLLTRAIAMGLDPAGAPLDRAMPRYQLSLADNADLIAYLKQIEQDRDPGLSGDLIRIGVVLPHGADSTGLGRAIRDLLESHARTINDQGGVYHRRVAYRFVEAPAEHDPGPDVVRDLTSGSEPVFAILAANLGTAGRKVPEAAERERVPLLGVVAPARSAPSPPPRWAFFLLAGPDDQALSLVSLTLRGDRSGATVAIVHGPDSEQRSLGAALLDRCRRAGLGRPIAVELADTLDGLDSASQAAGGAEVVLFLGPAQRTSSMLRSLASRGRSPTVLFPGTLADRDLAGLPASFDRRLKVALPIAPSDQTTEGLGRLHKILGEGGSTPRHRTAQIGALAAADVIAEGLRRAGRGLGRERFVAELERLRDFRTGLTPPLTFGPNRHLGSTGAHAIEIDTVGHRFVPPGTWADAGNPR